MVYPVLQAQLAALDQLVKPDHQEQLAKRVQPDTQDQPDRQVYQDQPDRQGHPGHPAERGQLATQVKLDLLAAREAVAQPDRPAQQVIQVQLAIQVLLV